MAKPRFEKCDREMEAGRLWRAKEILQGSLSQSGFDNELLEKYGQVLLAMGDDLEAGRYLFASGSRRPEYGPAIAIFLQRYGNSDADGLLAQMPAMIRHQGKVLREVVHSPRFAETGFPDDLEERLLQSVKARASKAKNKGAGRSADFIGLAVVLFVMAMFLIGFFATLGFVFRQLT